MDFNSENRIDFNGEFLIVYKFDEINQNENIYWYLPQYNIIVKPIKAKDLQLVIIDELKELFGITKIGTRWTKIKEKIYILYNIYYDNIRFYEPLKIKDFNNIQVYQLYFFRELLGMHTTKNMIEGIFINENFIKFFDLREQKITGKEYGNISIIEKNDFYLKVPRKEIAKKCFNINESFELYKIKNEIEKIITKIDVNFIFLSHLIYSHLLRIYEL